MVSGSSWLRNFNGQAVVRESVNGPNLLEKRNHY